MILLKARPCAGETDREIVAAAWDFKRINHYAQYLKVLSQQPAVIRRDDAAANVLLNAKPG